ncbi:Hook 3-like [Homarus americanus]|uniref:Hook 3-like n=1 Tax=Homarus americanus TaxID=6706 RepID=A0A8J5JS21_HOMAM|nr:Hook 3-like [Homarus americanus]
MTTTKQTTTPAEWRLGTEEEEEEEQEEEEESDYSEHGDKMEMGQMLQLLLGCAVNCENKQQYIEAIMNMEERVQKISVINEEKTALSSENEKLLNRLDAWETGGELGTSTLRYKDLKKQIDGLQDELYKLETSRDEYRTKADLLERENQEIQTRNEELQRLADEARSLKDEVDALREMSERAVVYEGTMETYKKKLEELSDLKRQVRILEEKNSDYVQHNMELEEEVKKSGTWRPQLDLYKKQVGELHQKLADEAKKTDRQIFENKKLIEKMEAIMQEKDRLTKERDALKENIEELKCHVSTLISPDTTSRPPSDLSDVELLEIVPHEIREKLMRLQHENSLLKQRAAEGGSTEQLPVLQTLVSDLQERQNSLTLENRWDSKGNLCFPNHKLGGECLTPPAVPNFSFLDAYLSFDPNRKMKLFKRNLKWASESDLLILRQPKGLLSTNFLSSTLPLQQPISLPPVPVSSSSFATQTSKESPIVIHHIHEFKMSPSPTNEDSGCCRTSPSSCEGCEDAGCNEAHSPDYSGTLDSGISGIYSGTLESGISGVFRCLSPVIPSIVEECTTHHMTDILPALAGHRVSSPSVMHHSHPAHTSCLNCCSPHVSQGEDNGEVSGKETGKTRSMSPLPPPRPHTVCSLNPPYKYNHGVSPTSTASLRNLPVSRSLSPHSNCSSAPNVPLSTLYLPSNVIDLSFVHTQSSKSLLSKPALDGTLPLSSQVSLTTTPTYTSMNPLPVSSPQGRRTGSGFPRSSIPPESPTPHNSPRLPNSINATRNRSCKNSSSTSLHNETSSTNIKEIPVAQSILVSQANSQEKGHKSLQEKNKLNVEKGSNKNILENSPLSSESRAPSPQKTRVIPRESSQMVSCDKITQPQDKDVKTCRDNEKTSSTVIPPPFSAEIRKTELKHLRSSLPQTSNLYPSSVQDKGNIKEETSSLTVTAPLNKINKDWNPMPNPPENVRVPSSSLFKYHSSMKSLGKTYTPTYSRKINSRDNRLSPKNSLTSKNNSAIASSNPRVSVPHTKSSNHVKFSEPVVSQVTHSRHETIPNRFSPASPRERVLALPRATTKIAGVKPLEPSKSKKNAPEVTLLTDTLFTRFEVSSKPQYLRLRRDIVPSTTDTDTDLETLERKLTLGMYAAPLVSSESCTSVGPDDGDEDPSATDYCTDNASDIDEYNPNQFKAYSDDEDHNEHSVSNEEAHNFVEGENIALTGDGTGEAASLVRTYSFFRKQIKAKKQKKIAAKESLPPPVNGGVVKPKNKTAKHMVAETFSAMFTLCTP